MVILIITLISLSDKHIVYPINWAMCLMMSMLVLRPEKLSNYIFKNGLRS